MRRNPAIPKPLATGATYLGCWGMVFVLGVREVALSHTPKDLTMVLGCANMLLDICALWVVLDAITRRLPRFHPWVAPAIMAVAIIGSRGFFANEQIDAAMAIGRSHA